MKLTRKQKQAITKLKGHTSEDIAKQLGLRVPTVSDYLIHTGPKLKPISGSGNTLLININSTLINHLKKFYVDHKGKIILITVLSFLVYLTSLPNSFVSDDKPLLLSPNLKNPLLILKNDPVTALINSYTYTLNYLIDGTNPLGYHLFNVLLHAVVSVVVFFFLYLIVDHRVAFVSAIIFAVNPIHTEAVSWVSGRHYILYTFFILLALIFYIFYTETKKKVEYFILSIGAFIASVYSFPEQAMIFPLLLPLTDICRRRVPKKIKLYLPFFALATLFAILSVTRVRERINSLSDDPQLSQSSKINYFFTTSIALFTYIKLFLYPVGLSFYHERFPLNPLFLSLVLSAAITIFVILPFLIFKGNKIIFFSIGFFLISLLPTITPLHVSWVVAERYAYLGTIGLSLALGFAFERLRQYAKTTQIANYTLVLLLIFYSAVTILRGFDWKDEDSLWMATVKASPDSSKAWNNMGDYYGRRKDMQKSFEAFVRATQINPTYSDAWHNAGNTLLQTGNFEQAIPYFEKSLEFNPNLIEAYNNLAVAYHRKKDREQSLVMIKKSLEINPNAAKTYATLAALEYDNGNITQAKEALNRAIKLEPENQALKQNLLLLEGLP